jgi:putative FmdB family regulatory protein
VPIFEFRCRACRKKTTALVLVRERVGEVRCRACGSADLEKLWSRFAAPKSEEARLEALASDNELAGLDENDPASMQKLMKKMGEATGEDLGDDFEAAMNEEAGQDPAGGDADGGDD